MNNLPRNLKAKNKKTKKSRSKALTKLDEKNVKSLIKDNKPRDFTPSKDQMRSALFEEDEKKFQSLIWVRKNGQLRMRSKTYALDLEIKKSSFKETIFSSEWNQGLFTRAPMKAGEVFCLPNDQFGYKINDPMIDLRPLLSSLTAKEAFIALKNLRSTYYDYDKGDKLINTVIVVNQFGTKVCKTRKSVDVGEELTMAYGFSPWIRNILDSDICHLRLLPAILCYIKTIGLKSEYDPMIEYFQYIDKKIPEIINYYYPSASFTTFDIDSLDSFDDWANENEIPQTALNIMMVCDHKGKFLDFHYDLDRRLFEDLDDETQMVDIEIHEEKKENKIEEMEDDSEKKERR